jgi:hypothetical protein
MMRNTGFLFLDSLAQTLDQNPLPVGKLDTGPHSAVHACSRLSLEIDFPSSESKIDQKLTSGRLSSWPNGGGGRGMMVGEVRRLICMVDGDKKIEGDTYYLSYSTIWLTICTVKIKLQPDCRTFLGGNILVHTWYSIISISTGLKMMS